MVSYKNPFKVSLPWCSASHEVVRGDSSLFHELPVTAIAEIPAFLWNRQLRTASSRFPGQLGRRRLGLAHGGECGGHPGETLREVFGVPAQMDEEALNVDRRAAKIAERRRQRRSTGTARGRNLRMQMNCVHAAAGQGLIRVLHQPAAVVAVQNHAGGDHNPLSSIFRRRLLTIPDLRLRHERGGIRKPILIQANFFEPMLVRKN